MATTTTKRAPTASRTQPNKRKYPSIFKASIIAILGLTQWYKNKHPELYSFETTTQSEDNQPDNEESELDLTMSTDSNQDDLFRSKQGQAGE